tara:strand:+ start:196 stop:336 length:141 start_codon:yes stop_codon:yes gene_type:complete
MNKEILEELKTITKLLEKIASTDFSNNPIKKSGPMRTKAANKIRYK